jgi:plastocyanin
MRRLTSAAAPLAVALALLLQGTALAATKDVTIQGNAFTPKATKVKIGDVVRWTNRDAFNHTSTSDGVADGSGYTGIGLWSSGAIAHNGTFSFTFSFAGTYPYHCSIHPLTMQGTIKVPLTAVPASGPVGSNFTVTWASAAPTGSRVFDVQRMDPGSTKFKSWQKGVTTMSAVFKPTAPGTYVFRMRLRNATTGAASKYSPTASISAT